MINQKFRYAFVLDFIKKHQKKKKNISICEIGSGSQGIGRYLKDIPFTGVDIDFSDYTHKTISHPKNMNAVKASATKLPFKDSSFDLVFSLDMIEHLQPKERTTAIKEMLRASKDIVIIGFPCGEQARSLDISYYRLLKLLHINVPGWLEEHIAIPYLMENEINQLLHTLHYRYKSFNNLSILLTKIVLFVETTTSYFSGLDKLISLNFANNISSVGSSFYRKIYVINKSHIRSKK